MKQIYWLNRISKLVLLSVVALSLSCGGGNNNNNAAPAAPVTQYTPGTSCPTTAGGTPLNSNGSPFYGSLQSTSNGTWGSSNSLTLGLSFINYTGPGNLVQSVVGSGALVFPDLAYILGTTTNTNSNVCVTSNNIGTTGYNPGTYSMGNGSLSMTLNGAIQVPLYNPFNNYPGSYQPYPQQQTSQDTLILNIGLSCPTYVSNNRIYGCVDVKVGKSPYGRVLKYYSR
jgi:hypothetical protein